MFEAGKRITCIAGEEGKKHENMTRRCAGNSCGGARSGKEHESIVAGWNRAMIATKSDEDKREYGEI